MSDTHQIVVHTDQSGLENVVGSTVSHAFMTQENSSSKISTRRNERCDDVRQTHDFPYLTDDWMTNSEHHGRPGSVFVNLFE